MQKITFEEFELILDSIQHHLTRPVLMLEKATPMIAISWHAFCELFPPDDELINRQCCHGKKIKLNGVMGVRVAPGLLHYAVIETPSPFSQMERSYNTVP